MTDCSDYASRPHRRRLANQSPSGLPSPHNASSLTLAIPSPATRRYLVSAPTVTPSPAFIHRPWHSSASIMFGPRRQRVSGLSTPLSYPRGSSTFIGGFLIDCVLA